MKRKHFIGSAALALVSGTALAQQKSPVKEIPLVQTLNYGKPAPTPARDVVDHSYSYNLIITFKSVEDIKAYGTHPTHTAGAEQFKKYCKRVEVKDTLLM